MLRSKHTTWIEIAPLKIPRSNLAVAVLYDKLYAIGGQDSQNQFLSSVECLDLSVPNSQWTIVAQMTVPRADMGVVLKGNKIYVAGGSSDSIEDSIDPNPEECCDPSCKIECYFSSED